MMGANGFPEPFSGDQLHDHRAAEHCAERATLSHAVSNAITEAYLRKKTYEDARLKGDPIMLWGALQTAREALARAVDASSKHIEEHGCKS